MDSRVILISQIQLPRKLKTLNPVNWNNQYSLSQWQSTLELSTADNVYFAHLQNSVDDTISVN